MNITADTNVLVRAIVDDNAEQCRAARDELRNADLIALTAPALCELVWVLSRGYRFSAAEIANAIRLLIDSSKVAVERPMVEAGLSILELGGDFADGVIAHQGLELGASVFASFDKRAVRLIASQGGNAKLL
ncbi:MAG: type II toxin-antitoxin system VapC family toxin [Parvularculaceae bacterium]